MTRSGGRGSHSPHSLTFTSSLSSLLCIDLRFWPIWTTCFFPRSFPDQHQNDLSSSTPGSAAWRKNGIEQGGQPPCSPLESLWATDIYISCLDFWHGYDSYVHHSTSFLCFPFHSTKRSFINPYLGVCSKALQGSSGIQPYHYYLLLASSILDMLRDIPPLLKYQCSISGHGKWERTMGRGTMEAREISKSGNRPTSDPEAQTASINHPTQTGIVFLLLLWLIQSYPSRLQPLGSKCSLPGNSCIFSS